MGKQSAIIAARILYPMIGPEPRRGTLEPVLSAWDLDSFLRSVWCPVDWSANNGASEPAIYFTE